MKLPKILVASLTFGKTFSFDVEQYFNINFSEKLKFAEKLR